MMRPILATWIVLALAAVASGQGAVLTGSAAEARVMARMKRDADNASYQLSGELLAALRERQAIEAKLPESDRQKVQSERQTRLKAMLEEHAESIKAKRIAAARKHDSRTAQRLAEESKALKDVQSAAEDGKLELVTVDEREYPVDVAALLRIGKAYRMNYTEWAVPIKHQRPGRK